MIVKPGALARRAARALTASAVIAGGVFIATPAHAVLPLPTISAVAVAGSPTNKVVTAGTTIQITGTGFTGMTDNAAVGSCSSTAAAPYPDAAAGCSQVRFLGVGATGIANFTVATRYNVVSDTTIYATVPTISAADGATGGPAAGTGSVRVQVLNTSGTGTSSLVSNSVTSELFYRKPLTSALAGATTANPAGGGIVPVTLSGGIATLTSTTLPQEKLTAYIVNSAGGGAPMVPAGPIALKDGTSVNVTLPPSAAVGNVVNVMVVHDGIPGTADTTNLTYPAVITKLENCGTTDVSPVPNPLPTTCTGPATAPSSGAAEFKVTGKGFTGATVWDWDGSITTSGSVGVEYTCNVVSDTLAFCSLTIHTVPNPPVVSVTFTPVDPDAGGTLTVPVLAPTSGGVIIYSTLV